MPMMGVGKRSVEQPAARRSAFRTHEGVPSGAGAQAQSEQALRSASRSAQSLRNIGLMGQSAWRSTYWPIEQRLAGKAELGPQTYVDLASRDVTSGYDRSREAMERDLSRMGIDPSSGRFAGLQQKWARNRAAALAGAMTRERRRGRLEDFQRMMGVAGIGQQHLGRASSAFSGAAGAHQGLASRWGDIAYGEAYGGAMQEGLTPQEEDDVMASLGFGTGASRVEYQD